MSWKRQQSGIGEDGNLDIAFVLDTTYSQEPYISATTARCSEIAFVLNDSDELSRPESLRMAVIAYRDYPEDENEFVTKSFGGFTSDAAAIAKQLKELKADHGWDPPEAVAAAMDASLNLNWRSNAAKIVVLVTDAPPHGIGETKDNYPEGDPSGKDPLQLARQMAQKGIALLVIACEPTLSNEFTYAHAFYQALVSITGGLMLPLTHTGILAPLIIGFALEAIAIDKLAREYEPMIKRMQKKKKTVQEISAKLRADLAAKAVKLKSATTDPVYSKPAGSDSTIAVWAHASSISEAKSKMLGLGKTVPRVLRRFRTPKGGWIKDKIGISLKNLDSTRHISYLYLDPEGKQHDGTLAPTRILDPIEFTVNTPYFFHLKCHNQDIRRTITFSVIGSLDLSVYFN